MYIHSFLHVFMKLARFAATKTVIAHSTHSGITLPAREALPALRHLNTDCEKTEILVSGTTIASLCHR